MRLETAPEAGKDTQVGEERYCGKCNSHIENDYPDACLAYLPGVVGACCGHGVIDGYILFENGCRIQLSRDTEIVQNWFK